MISGRILIVDDEPAIRTSFVSLLCDEKQAVKAVGSAEEAQSYLETTTCDLVLLDLQLPGKSGIDFLQELQSYPEPPTVLVISGHADIPTALQAVRGGAIDFLEKPVQPEKLLSSVSAALAYSKALSQRRTMIENLSESNRIIGDSEALKKMLHQITMVAPTDSTVLIRGENGSGKELVATRLFLASLRKDQAFIKVNCPGIPENLFESELFGHTKGAFTGAVKDHPGKFVTADGGTIFLDEIGDLPLAAQAKLLRVIENGEIETIGLTEERKVDVRIICATNRNLEELVTEGKFRQDLYYRISVVIINVPSLNERREDIPLLIGSFLRKYDPSGNTQLSPESIGYLSNQDYPGNVRQLKNAIERFSILFRNKRIEVDQILKEDLFPDGINISPKQGEPLASRMLRLEREIIQSALESNKSNISATARELGVDRANLSRKIKEHRLK